MRSVSSLEHRSLASMTKALVSPVPPRCLKVTTRGNCPRVCHLASIRLQPDAQRVMVENPTHIDQLFAGLQIKSESLTQWRLVAAPHHRKYFDTTIRRLQAASTSSCASLLKAPPVYVAIKAASHI